MGVAAPPRRAARTRRRVLTGALSLIAAMLASLAVVAAAGAVYGEPVRLGVVSAAELSEVSGIVASRRASGVFWVVNDGGNAAALHAINRKGRRVARIPLSGATNVDWEDIANGPRVDERATLYVGDFGDNTRSRTSLRLYIVREPSVSGSRRQSVARAIRVVEFRYPDGPHDAEALVVDPRSGRVFVFTKEFFGVRVYRFPRRLPTDRVVTLTRIASSRTPGLDGVALVTGADISPSGTRLVLRSYFRAWEFPRPAGRGLVSSLRRTPAPVGLPLEPQGEAIGYSRNGRALVTTSEGSAEPIWRIPRSG